MTTDSKSTKCPSVGLESLDELWFQVAGTRCNLECSHCFISCSPTNDKFGHLSLETVRYQLEDSVRHGVREYYFTGGGPFMHPALPAILADTLALGPATVLTNGTLFTPRRVTELARIAAGSAYSLELRVSLDGVTAEANDAVRGPGAFARTVEGNARVVAVGFLPIVTAVQPNGGAATETVLEVVQDAAATGPASPAQQHMVRRQHDDDILDGGGRQRDRVVVHPRTTPVSSALTGPYARPGPGSTAGPRRCVEVTT